MSSAHARLRPRLGRAWGHLGGGTWLRRVPTARTGGRGVAARLFPRGLCQPAAAARPTILEFSSSQSCRPAAWASAAAGSSWAGRAGWSPMGAVSCQVGSRWSWLQAGSRAPALNSASAAARGRLHRVSAVFVSTAERFCRGASPAPEDRGPCVGCPSHLQPGRTVVVRRSGRPGGTLLQPGLSSC